MPDICDLILADHATFRSSFAALCDDRDADPETLAGRWTPLADLLDRHAGAEESTFYPALLTRDREAGDETKDAVKDHNAIRDAVRAAEAATPGSKEWWSAVDDARKENDDHMGEEEEGPIPDFRSHADTAERERVGAAFEAYKQGHPGSHVDSSDKDPGGFVKEHRPEG